MAGPGDASLSVRAHPKGLKLFAAPQGVHHRCPSGGTIQGIHPAAAQIRQAHAFPRRTRLSLLYLYRLASPDKLGPARRSKSEGGFWEGAPPSHLEFGARLASLACLLPSASSFRLVCAITCCHERCAVCSPKP